MILSKKTEKIVETVFVSIFVLLFVFLTLSTHFHWYEIIQNIIMGLILLSSLLAVIYPLVKKEKSTIFEIIVIAFCFVLLVIAVIVFAAVSEGKFRNPMIQISSSVVGGMIALYGIGITIKYNRLEKENSDVEKAKPNVFPIGKQMWDALPKTEKHERYLEIREDLSDFKIPVKNEECYYFAPIHLANSDLSMCTLNGICINDESFIVFQYNNVILKGSNNCFVIDYCFKSIKEINSIKLVLGDMLGNMYACSVSFAIDKSKKKKQIHILGTITTTKVDIDKEPAFKLFKSNA